MMPSSFSSIVLTWLLFYHRYFNHKHRDATCIFAQARPPNALHSFSYYDMASVDMMPVMLTQLQLLEATGQSLQLLWEFFEQQVVPAIQMQSAPNCCPDEPTLSTDLFEEMLISSVQHQPIHKVGQYM